MYINTDSQVIPSATYASLATVHSGARVHTIPFVLFCKCCFIFIAFIYYNNAGADEFGIDPAFLCECALDISDPPVSEDKLNSSEGKFLCQEMYIVESTSSRNQFPDTRSLIAGESFVVQQFLLFVGRVPLLSVVRVKISCRCLAVGSVFHVSACQFFLRTVQPTKSKFGWQRLWNPSPPSQPNLSNWV